MLAHDAGLAAAAGVVPATYIGAATPIADLVRFRVARPQFVSGQTVGSGQFSPLEVPEQVNAMIDRFLAIFAPAPRATSGGDAIASGLCFV